MTAENGQPEEKGSPMSSGEALAEILKLTRENNSMLREIVSFMNQAGEQIEQIASQGIGELIGGLVGNRGD